jgi:hypothetical protein
MAKRHLNVIIDPELDTLVEAYAREQGCNTSQAVRMLLREALHIPRSPRDAIWREVRAQQAAELREAMNRALSGIPETDPGPKWPRDGRSSIHGHG